MEWTPPFSTGIEVPKWRCKTGHFTARERHGEDYDDWDRSEPPRFFRRTPGLSQAAISN